MEHMAPPGTTEDLTPPGRRIADMVEGMLARNGIARPFSVDDQLTDLGLTSLDMANLMLGVEAEFDVTIPSPDLTPANFRCIRSLETLIVRLRQGSAAPSE